jgi:hypothetical protein
MPPWRTAFRTIWAIHCRAAAPSALLSVHVERARQLSADVSPHFVTPRLSVAHFLDAHDTTFGNVRDVRVVVVEFSRAANLEPSLQTVVTVLPGHHRARVVLLLLREAVGRRDEDRGERSE